LNKFGSPDAHDVPWGTGKANVRALLAELARQGFQGTISVEYEHNRENSTGEIGQCIDFFDKVVVEVGG
jgi:sugar phosphate isomerase/epimerase